MMSEGSTTTSSITRLTRLLLRGVVDVLLWRRADFFLMDERRDFLPGSDRERSLRTGAGAGAGVSPGMAPVAESFFGDGVPLWGASLAGVAGSEVGVLAVLSVDRAGGCFVWF